MARAPKATGKKAAPPKKPAKTNGKTGEGFDPEAFLATAGIGRDVCSFAKKAVIFAQGESADSVFYIKKGKVKVAVVSEDGKEAVVALLGADEFVGEGCLLGQPKRLATASAMTECEIPGCRRAKSSAFCRPSLRSLAFSSPTF